MKPDLNHYHFLPRRNGLPTNLHKDLNWWSVPSSSSSTCPVRSWKSGRWALHYGHLPKIQRFQLLESVQWGMRVFKWYSSLFMVQQFSKWASRSCFNLFKEKGEGNEDSVKSPTRGVLFAGPSVRENQLPRHKDAHGLLVPKLLLPWKMGSSGGKVPKSVKSVEDTNC